MLSHCRLVLLLCVGILGTISPFNISFAQQAPESSLFALEIEWGDDLALALLQAYENDKEVLLFIEDATPPSLDFRKKVLSQKAFIQYIQKKYIPVCINIFSLKNYTKQRQEEIIRIREQYHIEKIPSLTVISNEDVLLAQIFNIHDSPDQCIKSLESQTQNTIRFISLLEKAFKQPENQRLEALEQVISQNISPFAAAKYYPKLIKKVIEFDPLNLYGIRQKYKIPLDAIDLMKTLGQSGVHTQTAISELNRFIKNNKPDKETLVEILCYKIKYIVENKGNSSIAAKTYFQVQELSPKKDISQWSFLENNFAVEKALYTAKKIANEKERALRYDSVLKTIGNEEILAYYHAHILREIIWIDSDNSLGLSEIYTPILALNECYLLEQDFFKKDRHSEKELNQFYLRTDEILNVYPTQNAETIQRVYYTKVFILAEQNRWQDVKICSKEIIELAPDTWIAKNIDIIVEQLKLHRQ